MKNLILILTLLVSSYTFSQDVTILHINAKWNTSNDYNLDRIRNAKY